MDHDDSVLAAVGTILQGGDHRVRTARDTREACTLLEQEDFDLIVADLQISDGANGNGLGEWLAQHKPALSRNLIWMCAVAPSADRGAPFAGDGRQVLQKPLNATDLLAAVKDLLLSNVQTAAIHR